MTTKTYRDGELILRQGDTGDHVGRVRSGEVEIFIDQDGSTLTLGKVGTGEFLGEMSVIGGTNTRSASARAIGSVVMDILDRETFLRQVSEDVNLAYALLERLSERLRSSNDRLAQSLGHETQPDKPEASLKMFPGTPDLEPYIPQDGLSVTDFPFTVGRLVNAYQSRHPSPDLSIDDEQPYRMSRRHFAILRSNDSLAVCDLGSTLGTEVNGQPIGEHFGRDRQPLSVGENTIVAGGHQSPFVFKVVVG